MLSEPSAKEEPPSEKLDWATEPVNVGHNFRAVHCSKTYTSAWLPNLSRRNRQMVARTAQWLYGEQTLNVRSIQRQLTLFVGSLTYRERIKLHFYV